jgi:predicted CoA-binding protein
MTESVETRAIPAVRSGRKVEDEEALAAIVRAMKSIAVVGMKGDDRPFESAFSIPQRLQQLGYRVLPVNPKLTAALGERAYPDLASVAEPFDLVDVFRRSEAVPELAEAVLALPAERRPRVVWMQSGIRNEEAAERLTAAGIDVVQDRCLGVYAGRYTSR